jgi:hypothetical protein
MVSPDGSLGGKGYIQKIAEMRRQYMNCVESLSALSDTLYDEIHAPHWDPAKQEQSPREREEVRDLMNDVEKIRDNPEEWAEGEEQEMDDSPVPGGAHKRVARGLDPSPKASLEVSEGYRLVTDGLHRLTRAVKNDSLVQGDRELERALKDVYFAFDRFSRALSGYNRD